MSDSTCSLVDARVRQRHMMQVISVRPRRTLGFGVSSRWEDRQARTRPRNYPMQPRGMPHGFYSCTCSCGRCSGGCRTLWRCDVCRMTSHRDPATFPRGYLLRPAKNGGEVPLERPNWKCRCQRRKRTRCLGRPVLVRDRALQRPCNARACIANSTWPVH